MSGALKVKAVLLNDGGRGRGSDEIRRFRVEEESGVATRDRFDALLTSVHSVFRVNPATDRCALAWKDEDGDFVQFSSNEELDHAVDCMCDDTLRVFVTVSKKDEAELVPMDSDDEGEALIKENRHVTFQVPLQSSESHVSTAAAAPPLQSGPWQGPGMHHWAMSPMRMMGRKCKMGPWGKPGMGPCGKKWGKKMGKKMWKMRMMATMAGNGNSNDGEFHQVRIQVPEEFCGWVRQYTRTWYRQGAEAAAALAAVNKVPTIPESVSEVFPQWLTHFLQNYCYHHGHHHPGNPQQQGRVGGEEEMLASLEGLPPVYYQWLCLFLPRFFRRQQMHQQFSAMSDGEEEGPQYFGPWAFSHGHGHGFGKGCHRRRWKHGCRGKKGGKHNSSSSSSSSESEDSDGGAKQWQKVPKQFRKYVRISMKQLHKNKGDNPKLQKKASEAGVSPEVREFLQQFLLEWHAKLSHKRPRAVAMEMMEGGRSLPAGLEQGHFQWLCRFMGRWHRRHAGKCDVMSGWSSGETNDDTSGDEAAGYGRKGRGPYPRFHRGNRHQFWAAHGGHHHGMMGHPPPHFHMYPGMNHPCHPPPPPPHMYGWAPPPPPPPFYPMGPAPSESYGSAMPSRDSPQGTSPAFRRYLSLQIPAHGESGTPHDDMVDRVTEGVKKL